VRQPKVYPIKPVRITEKPERTRLEQVTTLLQALSAILVPIVVAVAGLIIQQSIAKQTTGKDYVSLAIDILKVDPKIQDLYVGNPLREWAVDVLTLDSPVPISKAAQKQLRTTRVIVYDSFWDKAGMQGMDVIRKWSEKGDAAPTPKPSATP
jgi:hypothetical protein